MTGINTHDLEYGPSVRGRDFADIFAPCPACRMSPEAAEKLKSYFDTALHYVNKIHNLAYEQEGDTAAHIVTSNMHAGLFSGMRILRQRFGIDQWGSVLPNEEKGGQTP